MASKHILSLEVPLVANCEILSIRDTSQYSSLLPIDCGELLVTPPGFNSPALLKKDPHFFSDITACDLGLQKDQCETTRVALPDGVYIIKYSVAPNSEVFVEYNHLKVTQLLTSYHEVLCYIDVNDCEPHSERRDLIEEMQYIKTLIDAAISKVEYCGSPSDGMDLYNFALKRLNKIKCITIGCN